jgi:tetratricopeptide (TPR) repeat protein
MSKSIRIFLASSNELADDRIAFGDAVLELNQSLASQKKNVSFSLYKWEHETISFFERRKQDEYNQAIEQCDIFVMLYWSKVGKYTEEEYNYAYDRLLKNSERKPVVLVFQKMSTLPTTQTDADRQSLNDFNTKILQRDGQFRETYTTFNELKIAFEREVHKLFHKGILTYGEPATFLSPNGINNPTVFVGREDELRLIRERLDNGGKLMLINAEGGIGKTTLAARYWHESLYDYKHNAWLFCDNGIINALKELAPKLNIDLSKIEDEAEKIKALKNALSAVHDNFLLVLDNANDDEDIRIFRQEFEGFHWHVLITSRCSGVLEPEQELPITHLPPPLAKALFEKYYRENTPQFDELLERLLEAISYHTLLVEIFAKNMKESAELGIDMAKFLAKLESEGLHLGKHSFEIRTDYTIAVKNKAATTDQILDALYDFSKLSEDQRFLLVNIAFLPTEPYTLLFINALLANETNRTELNLRKTLKDLTKKGWIAQTDNTYRLSPVIQDLVLHKHSESLGDDAQNLLNRLNYFLKSDAYNLLNLKLSEADILAKLVHQLNKSLAKYPSQALASYNFNVGIYFNNIGDVMAFQICTLQYRNIYELLLKSSPENLEYKNGLAISYSKLGEIYEQKGDWENALLNYQERKRIGNEIYESSPKNLGYKYGLAISYSKLGRIYEQKGYWKNALLNYQEQLRIFKEIYESSPENLSYKNGFAVSYSKLGDIYQQKGDWKNALLNYQEQFRIFKEIYESSPENLSCKNGLAISYEKLGGIYEQTGDSQHALLNYQEYYRIIKEIYESSPENLSYKNGLAISLARLGAFYLKQNDLVSSLNHFMEGRILFYELWQATQGQIVKFTFDFALNTKFITDIIKHLLITNLYQTEHIPEITESVKAMRQEGYQAIKSLADSGTLQENQKGLLVALGDEEWYKF